MSVVTPLEDTYYEELAQAKDARQFAEVALEYETGFLFGSPVGGVQVTWVDNEEAAFLDSKEEERADGMSMASRVVFAHRGDHILATWGFGTANKWKEFLPTFEAMVKSVQLFQPRTSFMPPTTRISRIPSPTTVRTPVPGWTTYTTAEELVDSYVQRIVAPPRRGAWFGALQPVSSRCLPRG